MQLRSYIGYVKRLWRLGNARLRQFPQKYIPQAWKFAKTWPKIVFRWKEYVSLIRILFAEKKLFRPKEYLSLKKNYFAEKNKSRAEKNISSRWKNTMRAYVL